MGSRHPVNKLTALEVARLKIPGRYADGNNLYLLVEPSGAKRWVLRLTVNGRRRDMGFGNSQEKIIFVDFLGLFLSCLGVFIVSKFHSNMGSKDQT